MIHRHLDYAPGTPVTELGDAALDDILDRGDLLDWKPLVRAIAADPGGELADRVLRLCGANPKYGASPLWRTWIAHRRALAEHAPSPRTTLPDLRRRRGVSQSALATKIGKTQSDLSKAERRANWKTSTLIAIVKGLGLHLKLVVEDDQGRVVGEITPPAAPDPRSLT